MLGAPCQGSRLRQEDVFTRLDRAVPLSAAAVLLIAAAAWLALVREAGMGTMTMTVRDAGPLSAVGAVAFLTSWVVMMTAMMLPSAAPMVALYARMHMEGRKRSFSVGGKLDMAIEGVAGADGSTALHIDNTVHPANTRLALATAEHSKLNALGLSWSLTGGKTNGHYAPFSWRSA